MWDKIDFLKDSTGLQVVAWAVLVFAIIALVVGLWLLLAWIYYSWIKRNNSQNMTGNELTSKVFNAQGMASTRIISSIFYVKYWNHNKNNDTYRLRPWTYARRSIWTMMEAGQQAYATVVLRHQGKSRALWLVFRMPFILRIIVILATIIVGAVGLGSQNHWNFNDINFESTPSVAALAIAVGVLVVGFSCVEVAKIHLLYKGVVPLLTDSGLTVKELKQIKFIFFLRYVAAVIHAILNILILVLRIAKALSKAKGQQKN